MQGARAAWLNALKAKGFKQKESQFVIPSPKVSGNHYGSMSAEVIVDDQLVVDLKGDEAWLTPLNGTVLLPKMQPYINLPIVRQTTHSHIQFESI